METKISTDERFAFGENWLQFLKVLDDNKIQEAKSSLCNMLGIENLAGKTFLDIGSGSGLFSLAARQLGAKVYSFDYDIQSVACTKELKQRYFPDDPNWITEQGSALDKKYLAKFGQYDIVYSWGVLHHTGAMWSALENVVPLVKQGGTLFIAIYNDQGRASRLWLKIKKIYNTLPNAFKWIVLFPAFVRLWGPTIIRDLLRGNLSKTWKTYSQQRGMSPWRDVIDWVGGFPFEVAKPEQIFDFFKTHGFSLVKIKTCAGGLGCNEFVFVR